MLKSNLKNNTNTIYMQFQILTLDAELQIYQIMYLRQETFELTYCVTDNNNHLHDDSSIKLYRNRGAKHLTRIQGHELNHIAYILII